MCSACLFGKKHLFFPGPVKQVNGRLFDQSVNHLKIAQQAAAADMKERCILYRKGYS